MELFSNILIFTKLKNKLIILFLLLAGSITASAQSKNAIAVNAAGVEKFYPNPATSLINFDFSKGVDKQYTVQIYNFMGKKVYETVPSVQHITVSLDGFYRGVYIFQLRDKSGKVTDTGKFQVVK